MANLRAGAAIYGYWQLARGIVPKLFEILKFITNHWHWTQKPIGSCCNWDKMRGGWIVPTLPAMKRELVFHWSAWQSAFLSFCGRLLHCNPPNSVSESLCLLVQRQIYHLNKNKAFCPRVRKRYLPSFQRLSVCFARIRLACSIDSCSSGIFSTS